MSPGKSGFESHSGDITDEALVKGCYLISPNLSLSAKEKRSVMLSFLRVIWNLNGYFIKAQ